MTDPFGVYVHIPFCRHRCDYCAFATWTDRDPLIEAYVDALVTDIERSDLPVATSVFVGGGTPSRLPGPQMGRILKAIRTTTDAEVTIECNPDDVGVALFADYIEHGVNRVSLGVQSMVPSVLATLGRTHQPDNVRRAVDALRHVAMPTFNLDVIYGAAGETVDQWAQTVREVLAMEPPHVSAYALTVEPGTPLAADSNRHPDDDDLADKYEIADDLLTAAGLDNYEVSNWSRPGHECRHNLLYWRQGDYVGFGSAAHSHRRGRRWWNLRTPERIIAAVQSGESTEASGEQLDEETRRLEGLQLALRLRDGVARADIDIDGLDGLVIADGQRVRLTRAGRLMANEVSMRLH